MTEAIRVAICIPSSGSCKTFFAQSLAGLMQCGEVLRSRGEAGSFSLTTFVQESSNIPSNRESLVLKALEWNCTHVLFLDDDMLIEPIVMEMLLSRRQPFIACNYAKRQFPIEFTAVRLDNTRDMVTSKDTIAMEEALYTGFGACLIERKVFEAIPRPWFLPFVDPTTGEYSTEDNPFCQKVRGAGFKVLVDHTASRHIGHIGQHIYTWRDWKPEEKAETQPAFSVVPNTKVA
jgi:hypothetical protein